MRGHVQTRNRDQVPGVRCRKEEMGACGSPDQLRLSNSMSTTASPRGQYAPVKSPRSLGDGYLSPTHSHTSSESSLRALELSEGAEPLSLHLTRTRRSSSIGAFQFQAELLPLSLSEPERDDSTVAEKTVGLYKGEPFPLPDDAFSSYAVCQVLLWSQACR